MRKICWVFGFCALFLVPRLSWAGDMRVLCSTFPVYQITRQVAEGREGVQVDLLLPASLGCPHDYALTPGDMRKLAAADVLVVNGLGMEEFLGAPVHRANPDLLLIKAAEGIEDLLPLDEQPRTGKHRHGASCSHCRGGHAGHGHSAHACESHGAAVNPHVFASPHGAAAMARRIAAQLSQVDPGGGETYARQAEAYAKRLQALVDEMAALVDGFENRRVVQPHGAFDYLARDIGLEVVATTQPHGREPSAAEMLELVRVVRERKAGAIIIEPQYSPKVGETLARETGLPVMLLDPVASGPVGAPLDYYESVMRRNKETLRLTLGGADERTRVAE